MIHSEGDFHLVKRMAIVKCYNNEIFTFQCPAEGLQDFVTTDGLPFLHFVLRESSNNQTERVVIFLQIVLERVLEREELCGVVNRDGQTAGQSFPNEAHKILCTACKQGSEAVVNTMLDVGTEIDRFNDNAM